MTEVQPGVAIKYTAGEDANDVLNKCVIYGTEEDEVLIGSAGDTKFAGVIIAVTGARSESTAIGTIAMEDGDNITVVNDGIMEVIADGAVSYGDALKLADDGAVSTLASVDVSGDSTDVMYMVGRAQEAADDGDTFKALMFARK